LDIAPQFLYVYIWLNVKFQKNSVKEFQYHCVLKIVNVVVYMFFKL
jgi:hypothetical protein